ncbi:MAG: hypothetical protein ACUVQ1_09885 [Candidatus Kapaibacteriales bacterium]
MKTFCYFKAKASSPILLFIICILFFEQSPGQNYWARTFGESNEEASMAISSLCGNKIGIVGWTKSFGAGYGDILFVIFDNNGNLIFQKTFGESQIDEGFALCSDNDCGVLVGGSVQYVGFGSRDIALIRLDSLGITLWQTLIGNIDDDNVSSIIATPDGGFMGTGFSHAPYEPGFSIVIFKISSSGQLQWQKVLRTDTIAYDYGRKIIKLKNENYLVLCSASSDKTNQKSGTLLIEVGIDGKIVKNKLLFSQNLNLNPEGIIELDNGFIIVGTAIIGTESKTDAFILKISEDFLPVFCKLLKGPGYENLHNVIRTTEDMLYACGSTNSSVETGFDFWLQKFDSNGTLKFSKIYGGTHDEHCFALAETSDKGIVITGWTFSFGAGASDIMVLKVDSSSNIPSNSIITSFWEPDVDSAIVISLDAPLILSNYFLEQKVTNLKENFSNLIVIDLGSNTSYQENSPVNYHIKLLEQVETKTLVLVIDSEIEKNSEISLFDTFGREIYKIPINLRKGNQYVSINLKELSKGVFLIRESSNNIFVKFINR